MKKILLLTALLNSILAFSQCIITGADQLQVGERQVYKAAKTSVDSLDFYQWSHLDQKVLLENSTQQNELSLKGAVPGNARLTLEIKTKDDVEKCEKIIKVIMPTSNIITNTDPKCDFALSSFKEIKSSDKTVNFEPETSEINFTYRWTVYYRNGNKKVSTESKPQFEFSNEEVIDKVDMEVFRDRCTKKITKSYGGNFWYFF